MSAEGNDDKLTTIILEHRFSGQPFDLERYNQAAINRNRLTTNGASIFTVCATWSAICPPDRQRMICVFEAPDVEALRRTSRQLGYGYDQLWPATVIR